MASINLNFNLNSQVNSSLQVSCIDCTTNQLIISDYVQNPIQTFTNLNVGENNIDFLIADGDYSLNNFKFKLLIEGVYYETKCFSKVIKCGNGCVENYQYTGDYRCIQVDGVNTGVKELKKIDLNAFCTNNPEIWESAGEDLNLCPLVTQLTPEWDNSKLVRTCVNGNTKIKVGVKNNNGNIVQFKVNNVWSDANIGISEFEFTVPSNGVCESIYFRLKGTTNETWGCYTSFNSTECNTQSQLSSGLIQLKVYQECQTKNGKSGVFFKVVPFTPVSDINQFNITWSRDTTKSLNVPISQISANEWVLESNTIQETAGINVTISNLNDSYTFNLWSSTCNHDGLPIDCTDNQREVTTDKTFYLDNETVNATYNSIYNPCNGINWYNSNIPFGTGTNYTGVIQDFPVILHAQPNHNNETCKVCHGWSEVHLRGNNITPPISGYKMVYTNLYPTNNATYDAILNKFSGVSNVLEPVYTTSDFNLGSYVYKDSAKTQLFGTGYLAYFVGNQLKKVKLTNGIVTEAESNVTPSSSIAVGTKILAPFAHYQNGVYLGNGYAVYNGTDFSFWECKLNIASDGLTISVENWNPIWYWKFNKETVSNQPLVNFKIPEIYKGTTVDIQIVKNPDNNPNTNNAYFFTIQVGV